MRTHPGADEFLVEDDPGHEVDEADAGGEEGGDLGGAQDLEGEHVEVGGQRPQQREEEAPHKEGPCKTTVEFILPINLGEEMLWMKLRGDCMQPGNI